MLDVAYRDDGVTLGSFGRLHITVLREPLTHARVDELSRVLKAHVAKFGGKNLSFTLILPGAASVVDADVGKRTRALARDYTSIAAALVIDGDGFRAAMMRAALGATFLIARTRYPHKVFGTTPEALAWLGAAAAKDNVSDVPIAEVAAAIQSMRT